MANSNIETKIMLALKQIFTTGLINAYGTGDPLRLRTLKPYPLQADPTTSAAYLIYGPAYEFGRKKSDLDLVEIGAGVLWQAPFRLVCGTRRNTAQDQAYSDIEELCQRIENVVLANYSLSGILAPGPLTSDDGSAYVDAVLPSEMWGGTRMRIYGGDSEWYGEGLMYVSYNFYRNRSW